MSKIGVAIITCDRPEYIKRLLDTINKKESNIDELIIIDDGNKPTFAAHPKVNYIRQTGGKIGVGRAKNLAIINLLEKNCNISSY